MAYSRWLNSSWYTYWTCSDGSGNLTYKFPTKQLKNKQLLEICSEKQISYKEIKEKGITKLIEELKEDFSKPYTYKSLKPEYIDSLLKKEYFITNLEDAYEEKIMPPREYSEEDYNELATILQTFIEDVDNSFKINTFILENWYYPFVNKLAKT